MAKNHEQEPPSTQYPIITEADYPKIDKLSDQELTKHLGQLIIDRLRYYGGEVELTTEFVELPQEGTSKFVTQVEAETRRRSGYTRYTATYPPSQLPAQDSKVWSTPKSLVIKTADGKVVTRFGSSMGLKPNDSFGLDRVRKEQNDARTAKVELDNGFFVLSRNKETVYLLEDGTEVILINPSIKDTTQEVPIRKGSATANLVRLNDRTTTVLTINGGWFDSSQRGESTHGHTEPFENGKAYQFKIPTDLKITNSPWKLEDTRPLALEIVGGIIEANGQPLKDTKLRLLKELLNKERELLEGVDSLPFDRKPA